MEPIQGERMQLRELTEDDVPTLLEQASEESVARWWPRVDEAEVRRWLAGKDEDKSLVMECEGEIIGLIQYWEEKDPDYRHAGMDLYVASAHQGRGYGPEALRTLGRWLMTELDYHRLTIDPEVANENAIKAYASIGYQPVGVMRKVCRGASGEWEDALLMDLLREEVDWL